MFCFTEILTVVISSRGRFQLPTLVKLTSLGNIYCSSNSHAFHVAPPFAFQMGHNQPYAPFFGNKPAQKQLHFSTFCYKK